jgi:hypothetical protein
MTTTPARRRVARPLLALLIALLGAVPLLLTAGATSPLTLEPIIGVQSSATAIVLAVGSVLGLLLTPVLTLMGRIGAVVLAIPVITLLAVDLAAADPGPASIGAIPLDMLLRVMVPAGYFVLLFGALLAAGWGRAGSVVALGVAVACSVAIWVVPIPPLADIDMADRMVTHGLINVGVVVAGLAVLIEMTRRPRRAPSPAAPASENAASSG